MTPQTQPINAPVLCHPADTPELIRQRANMIRWFLDHSRNLSEVHRQNVADKAQVILLRSECAAYGVSV